MPNKDEFFHVAFSDEKSKLDSAAKIMVYGIINDPPLALSVSDLHATEQKRRSTQLDRVEGRKVYGAWLVGIT